MPDDRLFHKTLGHSEKVNSLTDLEEIVWRTYVNGGSDDFGVMRFDAAPLQNAHDRLLARPARQVMKMLERVAAIGLVETFTHQTRTYCFQVDWQDWQHIRYPQRTVHPIPATAMLARCSENTRWLLSHHPGGVKLPAWRAPKNWTSSGKDSGNASGNECASHARPLAVSLEPSAVSLEPESGARVGRFAYAGKILEVPRFLDEEFSKRLNGQSFDLLTFYWAIEQRLAETGEPWDLRWVRDRFAEQSPKPERQEPAFTREEKAAAERLRRSVGGCTHEPRCESAATCIAEIILGLRDREREAMRRPA